MTIDEEIARMIETAQRIWGRVGKVLVVDPDKLRDLKTAMENRQKRRKSTYQN